MNENRGDGSYIYENPLILDEDGSIWYGGTITLSIPSVLMIILITIHTVLNIWMLLKVLNLTLKTLIEREEQLQPNNSRIVDLHSYGYPTAMKTLLVERKMQINENFAINQITIHICMILCLTDTILKPFHLGEVITIKLIWLHRQVINK